MYQSIDINNDKNENVNNIVIANIFESIDKNHQIEINLIDDIAWFNIIKLDYENCKTFLILLKRVIEYLNLKNVKFIKQYINEEDLKYFEKSSYLEIDNDQYVISTEIIYFLSELTNALGIQKL
jgi:hypothetical protein